MKRLAASLVVAGDDLGLERKQVLGAAAACVKFYRTHIDRFAPMGHLETWYARLDVTMADELVRLTPRARKRLDRAIERLSAGRASMRWSGSPRNRTAPTGSRTTRRSSSMSTWETSIGLSQSH